VHKIGGRLQIVSAPGQGTQVIVNVPTGGKDTAAIRILIADDHAILRKGIRALLGTNRTSSGGRDGRRPGDVAQTRALCPT